MARMNYDYCEDKDLYNSGDIEAEMLEMYKRGEIPKGGRFFYATTPVRENIINWYPFKKQSIILEIGGGLGSVTGSLCKDAKKVISCEYSKRRAENIYYRHKNCDNLEVIAGNINKVKLKEKADYVVLVGVYEYAKRFFQTEEDPFSYFLSVLKSFLKPDGVILIAIENRYGIKYWAGATEDHYGVKYLGLEGYDDYDIQTLGKKELTDIIEKAGLKYKFYYPFPDYKMPYVVYTDERLPLKTELKTLKIYNHGEQLYNFDYRDVLSGLIDNDQFGFFSNSFLVEIGKNKDGFSDVVYANTSWIRSEGYQSITVIDNKNKIKKIPKNDRGVDHLDLMCDTHNKLKELGINISQVERKNNEYLVEYIPGISLIEHIYNLASKRKTDSIIKEIDGFYNLLKSISYNGKIKKYIDQKEKRYFQNKNVDILKVNVIDLHMGNIIKNKDKLFVIDQEWLVDYDIPMNYMLYFSLRYLFEWIPNFNSLFTIEWLCEKYGISEGEKRIYSNMSVNFSVKSLKNVEADTQEVFIQQGNIQKIDEIMAEINTKGLETNEMSRQLNDLRGELDEVKAELTRVYNSKRWKLASKAASVKRKIIR